MKFKVGDKCKIVSENSKCPNFTHGHGEYIVITSVERNYYSYDIFDTKDNKTSSCCMCFKDKDLQLLTPQPTFTPPFYVDCPTEEIWKKVEQKMFDMGGKWRGGDTDHYDGWHNHESLSCIKLYPDLHFTYEDKPTFDRDGIKHIPYQQFLGIEEETIGDRMLKEEPYFTFDGTDRPIKINHSFKETVMSYLRSIPTKIKGLISKNYQAFYQLGWVDSELKLTQEGREQLSEVLLAKHEDELGKVAIKAVKEAKKKDQDEE